ncbi:MAG TPA: Druantia anti-phage system protein DruA, partial [Terriglobales bacterium]|nr:Druantia anti-phage system protein DruA [Terriglobales bacterium]
MYIAPPVEASTPESRKQQVRAAHLLERDAQLNLPTSQKFLRDMEQKRLYRGTWTSVFSLMRDGRDLAERLDRAARLEGEKRIIELRKFIDPYVQVVETDSVCELTGLSLVDVWRYFRHTWNTPYFSTPGRKMSFLVRDRAARYHPVIGIGALGSSIVQLTPRDKWIGWSPDSFLLSLAAEPTTLHARWLLSSLNTALQGVSISDFLRDGVLTRAELRQPTERTILRLRQLSEKERRLHHLFPSRNEHKVATTRMTRADWKAQAGSHLFRSKRALLLARLLEARVALLDAGFVKATAPALRQALKSARARKAVRFVLRYVKSAHVGVDMMDITVCGAVAPYNAILGGKLVSLMMASPAVTAACQRKYSRASSVIASSMAGQAVRRKPRIVLLGTTSLYDVAPSQYNRLRVPAELAGGLPGEELQFIQLGKTVGFGSYHFSRDTMAALE